MYGFIYITTNLINGKRYIGQKKYDKEGTWKNYLGSGTYLKRAIEKYGKDNFSKEIVEECESKEKLDEREIYWISFYNAVDSDNFYNIASGGDGGDTISGYNESQKRKLSKKISKARKGKVNLGSSNGNSRKVICLNTMEIYDTIVEASQQTGINKDYIQQCCSEKSGLQTAGYINGERGIWKYYDENQIYFYMPFKKKKCEYINEVYCINKKESFKNATEAGRLYGINSSSISQCCNNKLLSAGKDVVTHEPLVWCYKSDIQFAEEKMQYVKNRYLKIHDEKHHQKKIKCLNTNKVFNSIKEAMQWCGGNNNNFNRTLKDDGFYYYKKHPTTGEQLKWSYV